YGISQMFFENQFFHDFVNRANAVTQMPLIPGIKILTKSSQLSMVPSRFFVDIPEAFSNQMFATEDGKKQKKIGIDWAFHQCVDLIEAGHSHLHFYILQDATPLHILLDRLLDHYPSRFRKQ
ncbi:MAG: methylenetetrahydrofolate reductase, partial [Deltaproteobacteria bacterium]|nr:methylenetetrahydrofolate reductase [Deltaproteobacteria bacterium]